MKGIRIWSDVRRPGRPVAGILSVAAILAGLGGADAAASLVEPGAAAASRPGETMAGGRATRSFARSIDATPNGTVTVINPVGSVSVTGWDRNEVSVRGKLGGFVRDIQVTREGDGVEVIVVSRSTHPLGDEANLEISVPANSRLDVRTFQAPIDVSGVTGSLDLESMNGRMQVKGGPRLIHADCISCAMDIAARCDIIRAQTIDGPVNVTEPLGFVELSTVSGNLSIRGETGEGVSATSVTGDISYSGRFAGEGSLVFETHSGDIDLNLPADIAADFDILNHNGLVESDFGLRDSCTRPTPEGTLECRFSAGAGGGRLKVRSFSGPVRIHRR